MANTCKVCQHPERAEIERQITAHVTLRNIARQFTMSTSPVIYHRDHCMAESVQVAQQAQELAAGKTILEQIRDLNRDTLEVLKAAKHEKRYTAFSLLLNAALRNMELQAKLTGEMAERPIIINIFTTPQWAAVEAALARSLEPFPRILEAVRADLSAIE